MDPLPPSHTRDFFDPHKLNELIQTHVLSGFKSKLNQIETNDHKLEVSNIKIHHKDFSIEEQKNAVLEKRDLTYPVKGDVNLIDKRSGQVVETKSITIANVPFVTNRNTVIYNGSEYEPIHQQRLLPGIYSRIRQSGEAEAHINPAPRTGMGGRILFLPDKQLFILMIQNTQIKLYGVMRDLGVSDSTMQQAWGEEIYLANKRGYTGDEIDKFYNKLYMS
jgi:DNA-directed RNA polymerase beta subunit